ncbi:arginase family protein [Leifsonia sp. 22587]|uniref:arginase family protein n=1 Tax=Leifsonia sp. 22587 TaxID=3453946 RepID=UPI003F83C12F
MSRQRRWGLVGVPSSAGGHTPGMDLAPAAIRAAGLVGMLEARGHDVRDLGDVRGFRRRPDPEHLDRQNIHEVRRVALETAAAVADAISGGRTPLVVGGDCTVTMGAVAGFRRAGEPTALVYMDGGPDLYTPGRIDYGNVDAMGLAHLLALPGSDPALTSLEGPPPLLRPDEVVLYGDALPEDRDDLEDAIAEQLGLVRVPASRIHLDPGAAQAALAAAEEAGERFLVHFDVDVLGHQHLALANMPNPDAPPWGLTVDEAVTGLQVLTGSERFAGIVLTEVNPNNAPDEQTMGQYVELVVRGLTGDIDVVSASGQPAPAPAAG